ERAGKGLQPIGGGVVVAGGTLDGNRRAAGLHERVKRLKERTGLGLPVGVGHGGRGAGRAERLSFSFLFIFRPSLPGAGGVRKRKIKRKEKEAGRQVICA